MIKGLFKTFLIAFPLFVGGSTTFAQTNYLDFKAKKLLVLSDADMLASAYYDQKTGNKTKDLFDQLTIIKGDDILSNPSHSKLQVSNSVKAWPDNMAISPDGRYVAVAELYGPAPLGESNIHHTPKGKKLTIIDLEGNNGPEIISDSDIAAGISAVSFHPNGKLIAVTTVEKGKDILIFPFINGKLGKEKAFDFGENTNPYAAGISHIEWHPEGMFLAACNSFAKGSVTIYKYDLSENKLVQWGAPLFPGKMPGMAYWTPDGSHLLVTNLYWGLEYEAYFVAQQKGMITSIRLDKEGKGAKGPHHLIVSSGATGGGPENFAISPDGEWVVSLNMELTALPPTHPDFTPYYTLTLFRLNDRGTLTSKGEYAFEGIMPEGITFDQSGKYFTVAVFDHLNPNKKGGSLDFFEIIDEENPRIIQNQHSISVMRGAHIVKRID